MIQHGACGIAQSKAAHHDIQVIPIQSGQSQLGQRNLPLIGCATVPGLFALSVSENGGAFRPTCATKNARNGNRSGVASSACTQAPTVAEI